MPKFFCLSDVHGFYKEMREALDVAGFDPNNKDHWLLGAGDYTDRGRQPQEVIDFLMGLDRCMLVKGNHESLLQDCMRRNFAYGHDYSNGTFQTIVDLAPNAETFDEACTVVYGKTLDLINKTVDYVELKHHIIVHGWLPLTCTDDHPPYHLRNRKFQYNTDWRNATAEEWEQARWTCGPDMALNGFNQTGKVVIMGHWHSSYLWAKAEGRSEFGEDAKFDPYYGDGFISIDACTAHSKKVNVLVIEDEFLDE